MVVVRKFQDLDVWQKAFEISIQIHKATLLFPKIEHFAMADQMRRASKSVCANLAEGFAKQAASKAEFKRYIRIALASANEMLVWLIYAEKLGYITTLDFNIWEREYSSICKMLNRLHSQS